MAHTLRMIKYIALQASFLTRPASNSILSAGLFLFSLNQACTLYKARAIITA